MIEDNASGLRVFHYLFNVPG